MATTLTTTIRVPVDLRDEIARLAAARGESMVDVVADAVHRLDRAQWWESVHTSIETSTPAERDAYQVEAAALGRSGGDGI